MLVSLLSCLESSPLFHEEVNKRVWVGGSPVFFLVVPSLKIECFS